MKIVISLAVVAILSFVAGHSQQMEFMLKMNSGVPEFESEKTCIPFQLYDHKIFIKVSINDSKPVDFIFDTGAITIIDEGFAQGMGIAIGVEIPSMPSMNKGYISKDKLSFLFGDFHVKDFIPIITKLPESSDEEPRLVGLIGSDILRFFCVSIDYQNKKLILSRREIDFGGLSYRVNMSKQFPMGFPILDTKIGKHEAKVMLDTGSPFSIVCPAMMIDSAGIFADEAYLISKGWFMKWPSVSSESNYLIQAEEINFGSLRITNVPVFLAELPMKSKIPLLGFSILNNYITTIDYPNNGVIFWPVTDSIYITRYFTGFSIKEEDQKFIVKGVWEKSPADKAGIIVGDEIVQFNEFDVKNSSKKMFESIMDNDSIMEVMLVIKRHHNEQRLKLKKENLNTMLQIN